MSYLRSWFSKYVFDMNNDQASPEEIHENIVSGIKLKGSPLVILFCAIIIASVGLNRNSSPVVIGAMLISPLMGTIIAMAYGISIYDYKILKRASLSFLTQIIIALVASILYFSLSPTKTATAELIGRTQPSFYDFIIAFFGGAAGIVGSTRKDKTNVIPGVAIATALMPPLCTVGYGIANHNVEFIFNPLYLFLINTFFIMLSTLVFAKFFRLQRLAITDNNHYAKVKKAILIGTILISIPTLVAASLTSYKTVQSERIKNDVDAFVTEDVNRTLPDGTDTQVIVQKVNTNEKIINLFLLGAKYTDDEIAGLNSNLKNYGLQNYTLNIYQGAEQAAIMYKNKVNAGNK